MRKIATVQTSDRLVNQLQSNIAQAVQPVLANPLVSGVLLTKVSLTSGANSVSHGLGRPLRGWLPVRVRSAATFYDTQDTNKTPTLTLALVSSAAVVADIYVF